MALGGGGGQGVVGVKGGWGQGWWESRGSSGRSLGGPRVACRW